MRIDTISTFPEMFSSVMGASMMKRAQEKGILEFHAHNLRTWTYDRHHTTDDCPYGGGSGLVMMCAPLYEALESVLGLPSGSLPDAMPPSDTAVVMLAPQGRPFDDACAKRLAGKERLVFACGHYEGMDERVYAAATDVLSIGDYVLTSGELASMVIIDATVRKLPGVLGAKDGADEESFADGMLEFPQYTRPASFRGMNVPEVLLSGHHARIAQWRRKMSLLRTLERRPDLIERALDAEELSPQDKEWLLSSDEL